MRILPLLFLAALPFALASNPDFSIIHQPANLVSYHLLKPKGPKVSPCSV